MLKVSLTRLLCSLVSHVISSIDQVLGTSKTLHCKVPTVLSIANQRLSFDFVLPFQNKFNIIILASVLSSLFADIELNSRGIFGIKSANVLRI